MMVHSEREKRLLRAIKDRLAEASDYDYEAREICHQIDYLLADKELPGKSPSRKGNFDGLRIPA